jgi:hypothetical protein
MKVFCGACNTNVPAVQIDQHKLGRRHQYNLGINPGIDTWITDSLKQDPRFSELKMIFPKQMAPFLGMKMNEDILKEVMDFVNCSLMEDNIECELSEETFEIFRKYITIASELNDYEQEVCLKLNHEQISYFMSKILKDPEWDIQAEIHKINNFNKLTRMLDENDMMEAEATIQNNYYTVVEDYMKIYTEAKKDFDTHISEL